MINIKFFKVSSKYYIPESLWPKNQTFPPYPSGALFIIKNSIQGSAPGSGVGTDQDVIDLTGGSSSSQVSLSWYFVSQS